MTDLLTIVGILSLVIPVIGIIKSLLPTNAFITKVDKWVNGRFLITIMNFTYLKVCFLVFLNFLDFSSASLANLINSFASIGGLVYVVCVPIYYAF